MKKKKKVYNANIKVALLETIAAQNGLTVEFYGDEMEGYSAFFKTPYEISSDGAFEKQRVESIEINMDNDNDILGDLPQIYRAVKNLMADRCDYITNKEKEFFKKVENDRQRN